LSAAFLRWIPAYDFLGDFSGEIWALHIIAGHTQIGSMGLDDLPRGKVKNGHIQGEM